MKHLEVIRQGFREGYRVRGDRVIGKNGKPLSRQILNSGYYASTMLIGKKRYNITNHQVIWLWYEGTDTVQLNHKNGNKLNNYIGNLEACTQSHNNKHAYRTGLRTPNYGAKSGRTRLTAIDVLEMRLAWKMGVSQKKLAERYGIKRNSVSYIVRGLTWSHI